MSSIGKRFEAVAREYPTSPALVWPSGKVCKYRELDEMSSLIGGALISRNQVHPTVVMMAGDKSELMYAAILGALKFGITYTIYDPQGPAQRLEKIIRTCRPSLVIRSSEKDDLMHSVNTAIQTVEYSDLVNDLPGKNPDNPLFGEKFEESEQPAYIMFTSGSTGEPKGAMISHSNLLSFIDWSLREFSFGPGEVLTNINPSYFDNFVFDYFSALFSGSALAIFSKEIVQDPKELIETVDRMKCTSLFSVPSMLIFLQNMRVLTEDKMKTIRQIIFGGEGYPKGKLHELYRLFGDSKQFYNVYGPTECTCICSCYKVSNDDFLTYDEFLPLGSMIRGFGYFILGEDMEEVPIGEKGELYLSGPAVGLGYCNDPVRTDASFLIGAVGKATGVRMYRTGDVVYQSKLDRKIYISGRSDNQIKHMGHRIELEEVELSLNKLKSVDEACCVHIWRGGLSRLVGVLVTKDEPIEEQQIVSELMAMIPKYMIPNDIIFSPFLPKNANGKVDRKIIETMVTERNN